MSPEFIKQKHKRDAEFLERIKELFPEGEWTSEELKKALKIDIGVAKRKMQTLFAAEMITRDDVSGKWKILE